MQRASCQDRQLLQKYPDMTTGDTRAYVVHAEIAIRTQHPDHRSEVPSHPGSKTLSSLGGKLTRGLNSPASSSLTQRPVF